MANVEGLKKGEKFWCRWMSRNLYFVRELKNRYTGITYYVFEDITDARFDLTEEQVGKLERKV